VFCRFWHSTVQCCWSGWDESAATWGRLLLVLLKAAWWHSRQLHICTARDTAANQLIKRTR